MVVGFVLRAVTVESNGNGSCSSGVCWWGDFRDDRGMAREGKLKIYLMLDEVVILTVETRHTYGSSNDEV